MATGKQFRAIIAAMRAAKGTTEENARGPKQFSMIIGSLKPTAFATVAFALQLASGRRGVNTRYSTDWPLCGRPHDGGAPMKSRFPISTPHWRMMS
jgi:hypothetical protein